MRHSNPNKLLTRGFAAVAASVGLIACASAETREPFCSFSSETTTAEIPAGGGIDHAVLQIAGVTKGTCYDSGVKEVARLNPDTNIRAPWAGEVLIIPQSAEFNEG